MAGGSDAVVVRVPVASSGLHRPLCQEEGERAGEAHQHQDEQLPVEQQVVAVEERHRRHDGLWRGGGEYRDVQRILERL